MTAVKAGDVDRLLKSRPPGIDVILLYGPDAGRITERARDAARSAVDDPEDAFQLIRMDGDHLAESPPRLVEEASTYGMFGGRRAIWVRPTSRNIAPAVSACLDTPLTDTLVVIEAGDLAGTAPLRQLCEASKRALAMPCYADEVRDLGRVVTEALQAEGFTIDNDARELLVESLGGDRLATRGELTKLALYARGRTTITADDVEAAVSDVSGISFDAAIDAAFGGDASALDTALQLLWQNGTAPAAVLALALRHALALQGSRAALDEGADLDTVLRSWRGLNFRRKPLVSRQIGSWPSRGLERVVAALQETVLQTRQAPALAQVTTARALLSISEQAARRSRR